MRTALDRPGERSAMMGRLLVLLIALALGAYDETASGETPPGPSTTDTVTTMTSPP